MIGDIPLLLRMAGRSLPRLSWRTLPPLLTSYALGGLQALRAHRRRLARGQVMPPFLMISLTDACNLRCAGCWVSKARGRSLAIEHVDRLITTARRYGSRYFTLLGGEPLMWPALWALIARHRGCYFQIITNGTMIDEAWARRCAQAGNVTPLLSIDGDGAVNDARRGRGSHEAAMAACAALSRHRVFFGVATTITAQNIDGVLDDGYVRRIAATGAHYLWYYGYRPMGRADHRRLQLDRDGFARFRRELMALRKRHPLLLIDTYWDADGNAVCPAAEGLCAHIGPAGDIEACPPLSFSNHRIDDAGPLDARLGMGPWLRAFRSFVQERTKGCVIIEDPHGLAELSRGCGVHDSSTRDLRGELEALQPACSHHLPDGQVPERGLYRFFKQQLFFGMGAYA